MSARPGPAKTIAKTAAANPFIGGNNCLIVSKPASRFAPEKDSGSRRPSRCVVCGADTSADSFDTVEPGFSVVRCPDCRLGRTLPALPISEIASFYPPTYYGKENVRFNAVFERMTRVFQLRRARVILNRVSRGPVLDIGCGRGFFLDFLRKFGFEPKGVELSDTAAWHARERLGLEVWTGDFLEASFSAEAFHATVFWHTLEHFPDPAAAVRRASELLKTGGLMVVAVPNSESFQGRFFGRYWFHLDIPRHYFHFGAKNLEALLARNRLRIVQIDHFCIEQNPYGWLQSFYNALGFDNNFFYSLLKNRTARTVQILHHPFQTAGCLILLPVLLPLSLAMTLVEALFKRGGTIEVYALKE